MAWPVSVRSVARIRTRGGRVRSSREIAAHLPRISSPHGTWRRCPSATRHSGWRASPMSVWVA